ncbi:methionine adenosyltransferase [Candidatus Bipolaricaulota bacterium]|nr:methionine adenosyltransferase [Candidatus Bipolaricaulota bacterium]
MAITTHTSESVTEGHPDKLADRISDAVLDAVLERDVNGRVACETFITTGLVIIGGEISTDAYVDLDGIARRVIADTGYDKAAFGFHYAACAVLSVIKEQSADIAAAVGSSLEVRGNRSEDPLDALGAGDQGIMYGYACKDTPEFMPLPIALAHRLAQGLATLRRDKKLPYLRPDGKTQVTIEYEGDRPIRATKLLIAAQHDPSVDQPRIAADLKRDLVEPLVSAWLDDRTEILVNSSGRFVIGGPASDAGMTGRKIIVDTYGGYGSHGGGAFSGKDPSKVDRTGAYMARYVAKHLVAAGLAEKAEVQIAYAIGRARPLAVHVSSLGTGSYSDDQLRRAVESVFDFRPEAIIERFELRRPQYEVLSSYGHFGRPDLDLRWEKLDRIEPLHRAIG